MVSGDVFQCELCDAVWSEPTVEWDRAIPMNKADGCTSRQPFDYKYRSNRLKNTGIDWTAAVNTYHEDEEFTEEV